MWHAVLDLWINDAWSLTAVGPVLGVLVFAVLWRRRALAQLLDFHQDSARFAAIILFASAALYILGSYLEGIWFLWLSELALVAGYMILLGGPLLARAIIGPLVAVTFLVPIPGLIIHARIGVMALLLASWLFLSRRKMKSYAVHECEVCEFDATSAICGFCGRVRRLTARVSSIRIWARIATLVSLWILALSLGWPVFALTTEGWRVDVYGVGGIKMEPLLANPPGWLGGSPQVETIGMTRSYDILAVGKGVIHVREVTAPDSELIDNLRTWRVLESGEIRGGSYRIYQQAKEIAAVWHWSGEPWFITGQGFVSQKVEALVSIFDTSSEVGVEKVRSLLGVAASSIADRLQNIATWTNNARSVSELVIRTQDYALSVFGVGAVVAAGAIARGRDRKASSVAGRLDDLGSEDKLLVASILRLQNRRLPTSGMQILSEFSRLEDSQPPSSLVNNVHELASKGVVSRELRLRGSLLRSEWQVQV